MHNIWKTCLYLVPIKLYENLAHFKEHPVSRIVIFDFFQEMFARIGEMWCGWPDRTHQPMVST